MRRPNDISVVNCTTSAKFRKSALGQWCHFRHMGEDVSSLLTGGHELVLLVRLIGANAAFQTFHG